MKKILLALLMIGGLSSFSLPVPVDINEKVLKAFKEAFSDAKDVVWSEVDSYYEVKFKQSEVSARLKYDQEGNVIEAYRYYQEQQLPPYVLSKLKKKFADKKVFGVTEVTKESGLEYFITLEDQQHWYTVRSDSFGNLDLQKKFKKA
jgi:hypothetical protein